MPGARCTRGLVCKGVWKRTRAYRAAESIRHSLRNGVTAYTRSPRGAGLIAPVASPFITAKLDTGVGVPGPHDFAVRIGVLRRRTPMRPSLPAPNTRDDPERPS
jgi:hypothetical protein